MKKLNLILIGIFFIFLSNFILAAPEITIVSPENTTYAGGKLLVNVTSTEPVTFFMKEDGRNRILAENVEDLQYDFFGRNETFELEIWANNSNGEDSDSVIFSMNYMPNPFYITDCESSINTGDTLYILANDLDCTGEYTGVYFDSAKNATLDLNGFKIENSKWAGIEIDESPNVKIFNGEIIISNQYDDASALVFYESGAHIHDLNLSAPIGFTFYWYYVKDLLVENVNMNVSQGIYQAVNTFNTVFKNVKMDYNGLNPSYGSASGIYDESFFTDITLENVEIDPDFPSDIQFGYGRDHFYKFRNMNFSSEKITSNPEIPPSWWGWADNKIFKQKLLKINVTDQNGNGVPATVEINDILEIEPLTEDKKIYSDILNPTEKILDSTDEEGKLNLWLTEKTYGYKFEVGLPLIESEHIFDPYTITVRSGSAVETFNVTFGDSEVIQKDIIFQLAEDLQDCSLQQSLDLNGDSSINIQDAVLVLRYITGQSVALNEAKDCKSWSLFADI